MDYTEITVDPKFHRHLIGKGGVNSESSLQRLGPGRSLFCSN